LEVHESEDNFVLEIQAEPAMTSSFSLELTPSRENSLSSYLSEIFLL